jgi:hypothetical protein
VPKVCKCERKDRILIVYDIIRRTVRSSIIQKGRKEGRKEGKKERKKRRKKEENLISLSKMLNICCFYRTIKQTLTGIQSRRMCSVQPFAVDSFE